MKGRVLLLLGLVAVVGVIVWGLSGDDPAPPPVDPVSDTDIARTEPFVRAQECQSCHQDVYAEWEESYHGMAWTDPMVQDLSSGFRDTECIDCHAPQPIHITGIDQRVAPRQHARSDGVDCLSCHLLPDGVGVAANRDVDTTGVEGACRPQRLGGMDSMDVCAGCHNQHETVDEVIASGVDETCQTCHMPEATRAQGRVGRSHRFPGAHSIDMHRRAVKLEVRVEDGAVLADVTNVGAAHHVPTDARHRSYNLWVEATDAKGNLRQAWTQMDDGEMRLYYRQDFKESTQVAHMETHTGSWPLPQGFRGMVKVRLTYALNPHQIPKNESMHVHETEIQIP